MASFFFWPRARAALQSAFNVGQPPVYHLVSNLGQHEGTSQLDLQALSYKLDRMGQSSAGPSGVILKVHMKASSPG